MLSVIFWDKWTGRLNLADLTTVQKKKIIFSPGDLFRPKDTDLIADIIPDCYTFDALENNMKAVFDWDYTAAIVNDLDVMIENTLIKKSYPDIKMLREFFVKLLLKMSHSQKEFVLILQQKMILSWHINKMWDYITDVLVFKPNIPVELDKLLEMYAHNCWQTTIWDKVHLYPNPTSNTFSKKIDAATKLKIVTAEKTPSPALESQMDDIMSDISDIGDEITPATESGQLASTDTPSITWKIEWVKIYNMTDNNFWSAVDAEWIFDKLASKAITPYDMKEKVLNSKKFWKDKVTKALNFIWEITKALWLTSI
jgi:hypothetical protein